MHKRILEKANYVFQFKQLLYQDILNVFYL
mgnify:CR=1 FL=1